MLQKFQKYINERQIFAGLKKLKLKKIFVVIAISLMS